MPVERKRKTTTPEAVPELGDPDRKRVLNVLAQRRYRQKRREKIAELEAKMKGITPPATSAPPRGEGGLCDPVSTPSVGPVLKSAGESGVEELMRNANDVDFPGLDFNQDPIDFGLYPDLNTCFSTTDTYSTPSTTLSISTHHDPTLQLDPNAHTQPPFNFPLASDGGQLDIPILPTLRAFGLVASALKIASQIFDPFYLHVLPPTPHPDLPPNLHPTPAQIMIPHHPVLDTLPWPSVREKLICMLSLPSALRPAVARDEQGNGQCKAIMQLMHDLDDTKDGVRNHGNTTRWGNGNELVEEAWEVGELFYQNWWWSLDKGVVELSNRRRRERGLDRLRIRAA